MVKESLICSGISMGFARVSNELFLWPKLETLYRAKEL